MNDTLAAILGGSCAMVGMYLGAAIPDWITARRWRRYHEQQRIEHEAFIARRDARTDANFARGIICEVGMHHIVHLPWYRADNA